MCDFDDTDMRRVIYNTPSGPKEVPDPNGKLRKALNDFGFSEWQVIAPDKGADVTHKTVGGVRDRAVEHVYGRVADVILARLFWGLNFMPDVPAEKGGFFAEEMISDCMEETHATLTRALERLHNQQVK